MNLLAIGDLHLSHSKNWNALRALSSRPDDWLILAGDVGDTEEQVTRGLQLLLERFAKVIWVPGNHELWTTSDKRGAPDAASGEARYGAMVALARSLGVITPEDPYPIWPAADLPIVVAPLFLLYDYSFRPDDVSAADVLDWAAAEGVVCADEALLHPTPHPDRRSWCAERVARTAERLAALPQECATVLVNHYPLLREHAVLPRIPRFAPWCGTRLTEDWHRRFRAVAVVYGHLHVRNNFEQDGVAFHEVSLGYPGQWNNQQPIDSYLRVIL
jgi:predicted phosphodiesterase